MLMSQCGRGILGPARNPKGAGEIVWKAVQHFSDGTSTQWSGPKGDKNPASVVHLSDKTD